MFALWFKWGFQIQQVWTGGLVTQCSIDMDYQFTTLIEHIIAWVEQMA